MQNIYNYSQLSYEKTVRQLNSRLNSINNRQNNNMELTTEYLIIIEKKTSEALFRLCDSIRAFKKFLQTESNIRIDKDQIIYKDHFNFSLSRNHYLW